MFKKLLSVCLCFALVIGIVPVFATFSEPEVAEATVPNPYVMPSHNGKTNNVTYTLGAGTDAEVPVYVDFRSTSQNPTGTITPKYIMIHNTGTYVGTASAKNVHNNTNKTSTSAAWHYTVDNVAIYQGLADNRKGWHAATSYSNYPSNVNAIGIETCVNYFPATETFGGEQWTNGTAIMNWWKERFDATMRHSAYLAVVLCKRWGLNWETDIVMHWNAFQYSTSSKSGKDCPMQMRATYNPSTNQFKAAGTYANGRDGYFWQIFWGYVTAYASGSSSSGGVQGSTAAKLGTYRIKSSDGLNVRTAADANSTKIGEFEMGDITEVTELNGNWGKVTLDDGQVGWCSIANYGEYIGIDALAQTVKANSDSISYSYDKDGGMIINNTSAEQGQVDFTMPFKLGNLTTKMMSLCVTPISGNGYFFGITQQGSGFWMMRDCQSGDQLVNETSAPYMTGTEKLQIDISEWWKPEEDYQVDQMRFYLAPNTSIKINYCYFASGADVVIDERYNLLAAATNVNLMDPDKIVIVDESKLGKYVYSNGMLTLTADTAAGFEVAFLLEQQYNVNELKRLLVGVEAHTDYNISMLVSHANGQGWVSLTADYWPSFTETAPTGNKLPAWTGTAGLDFNNYFVFNNVLPADGMITIHKVFVTLYSQGTTYINGLQLAENDRLLLFRDGKYKEGTATGAVEPEPPVDDDPVDPPVGEDKGDVNGDGNVTTMDARLVISFLIGTGDLNDAQQSLADYDGSGSLSTADVREMLFSVLA